MRFSNEISGVLINQSYPNVELETVALRYNLQKQSYLYC